MSNPSMKLPFHVSLVGLACFLVSLLLPAVEAKVFGATTVFMGWQATASAVGLGIETLIAMARSHTREHIGYVVLGAAGVLNIVFLITPLALMLGTGPKGIRRWLTAIAILGLVFALLAPRLIEDMQLYALTGYYVWLLAYVVLLASLVRAGQSRGK